MRWPQAWALPPPTGAATAPPASATLPPPALLPCCRGSLRAVAGQRATVGAAGGEGDAASLFAPAWLLPSPRERCSPQLPGARATLLRPPAPPSSPSLCHCKATVATSMAQSPEGVPAQGSLEGLQVNQLMSLQGNGQGCQRAEAQTHCPLLSRLCHPFVSCHGLGQHLRRNTGWPQRAGWWLRGEVLAIATAQSKAGRDGGKPPVVLGTAGMCLRGVQDQ